MEAMKLKPFRKDFQTVARRLLAINGYSVEQPYNPHNVKAFVLAHEYSVFCVAIGSSLQEALDNAVDNGCLDIMLIEEPEADAHEWHVTLGNAGDLFNIDYLTVFCKVEL